MNVLLITTAVITGIGLVCGVALAFIAKKFGVDEDPTVTEIEQQLPGANCGGCGYAGCTAYAKAIVEAGAPINKCGPGGADTVMRIGEIMGVSAEAPEPVMAFIKCGGDRRESKRQSQYNGIADCASASLVAGGWKECQYGCLGYGSCARVCNYGAISIKNGLAVVNPALCVGCGMCVNSCPRNLIVMVPVSHRIHVRCSSPNKGPVVRKICDVGCIGCTICVKTEGGVSMEMKGSLAQVNYEKPPVENEAVLAKCPMKCIVKLPE